MLTVFGTVLPVIAKPITDPGEVKNLTALTPLERFATGLDIIADSELTQSFHEFLNAYEKFLSWKERMGGGNELTDDEMGRESRIEAQKFSSFIYKALSHDRIEEDFKKYLVL
jgi:hypothetical protein